MEYWKIWGILQKKNHSTLKICHYHESRENIQSSDNYLQTNKLNPQSIKVVKFEASAFNSNFKLSPSVN